MNNVGIVYLIYIYMHIEMLGHHIYTDNWVKAPITYWVRPTNLVLSGLAVPL